MAFALLHVQTDPTELLGAQKEVNQQHTPALGNICNF